MFSVSFIIIITRRDTHKWSEITSSLDLLLVLLYEQWFKLHVIIIIHA